jgi:HAD superfamily hydrolase (TIGR01549 family)
VRQREPKRLLRHQLQDLRLTGAADLLAEGRMSVLSLDIFDTLVWRIVADPRHVFILLGHRLQEAGHLPPHVSPELFAVLREKAETRARRSVVSTVPSGEVSLSAIYEHMPSFQFGAGWREQVESAEVELEREICFPDLQVVQLALLAQEVCGARIILVSDTYFSEAQLRHVLDRDPFTSIKISDVFASSEHGVGKGSGLFKLVLESLGVAPDEVLHVGDHADSDVACARDEGVHAVHFERFPGDLRAVLEREGIFPSSDGSPGPSLSPQRGDFGLTAMRSKVSSSTEGAEVGPSVRPYWRFGATVLGPVFTGFAEWVDSRAREEGVTRVYGIMREGEFLARLLNNARRYLGSPVRAETIWLSRDLCARASLFDAGEEELVSFLNRRHPPTLRQLCETLGVDLAQLTEVADRSDGRLDDPELREEALAAITGRPDVRAAIVATSARVRQRLVKHFLNTARPESGRVVLFDLGWGATIQGHLDAALRAAGVDVRTIGLYLLTNSQAAERMLDGVHAEGYLASGGVPERKVRFFIRSPEILEQVCMPDVGSLVDFTPDGDPVPGPVNQSPLQMLQRSAVQRGIATFQRQWGRYRAVLPHEARTWDRTTREQLFNILVGFIVSPTAEESSLFGRWSHDANYGSDESEKVISRELVPFVKHMSPSQLVQLPMHTVYWPFGLAALHNPPLARAAAAIAAGAVGPGSLPAGDDRFVYVSVDSIGLASLVPRALATRLPRPLSTAFSPIPGFRAVRKAVVQPSGAGLCFARQEITWPRIRGLQVVFPEGPGLVRLDRMLLKFTLRGSAQPATVTVEWPKGSLHVIRGRGRRLARDVLFGARRSPSIYYPCPRDWDAYKVEIDLAFAWIPVASTRKAVTTTIISPVARRAKARAATLLGDRLTR